MRATTTAAATIAAAATLTIAAPAHADNGRYFHYNPDNGYDAPTRIACDDGTRHDIAEGWGAGGSTNIYCDDGVRSIYMRVGEELHCRPRYSLNSFSLMFDATGWHPIGAGWNYECVMQAD